MEASTGAKSGTVIGLDLGGTKLAAALFRVLPDNAVDLVAALPNIHYKKLFGEHGGLTAQGKSRVIEKAMADAVAQLLETAGESGADAVGVASAGFVENDTIIEAKNTGMKNYPLRDRLQRDTGIPTFLYKDSWAPVYAAPNGGPGIIFSIGTGFGGVAFDASRKINLRSRSANRRLMWIPELYAGDDPGYAVSFSDADIRACVDNAIKNVFSDQNAEAEQQIPAAVKNIHTLARVGAKEQKKLSPSRAELFVARAFAPAAADRINPGEVFADYLCGADFPLMIFEWITDVKLTPDELDRKLAGGDAMAAICFSIHAECIGRVLAAMQAERVRHGFEPVSRIYGCGSGFNEVNQSMLGPAIARAMLGQAAALNPPPPVPDAIELLICPAPGVTLACYGAAVGAARCITDP